MFVKKSSEALKSILRATTREKDSYTLPIYLSILRDETSLGRLIITLTKGITKLTQMDTVALSPNSTLPPRALFPWLGQVRPFSTSTIPMISGRITPTIMQEALRSTPNHKVTGSDGVPFLVLKHMPPAFHESLRLLFKALVITGITPPPGSKATPFSSIKRRPNAARQLPPNYPSQRILQAMDYLHSHYSHG
jgi:hypothetical protein